MTAPKFQKISWKKSDWEGSDLEAIPAFPCPGNCHHPVSKSGEPFLYEQWKKSPSLFDQKGVKGSLGYFDKSALEAWIKNSPTSAGTSTTLNALPAPLADEAKSPPAIDPKQAAVFLKAAQENEKQAAQAGTSSSRLAYYQTALNNYQLAQNIGGAKKILGLMRKEYRQMGHEVGITKVEAELAFLDGEVEKAVADFRSLEEILKKPELKLSKEDRDAALFEVNLKLSLGLQALGDKAAHERKFDTALACYDEALRRTPSPMLSEKLLTLLFQSGKGNLEQIGKDSEQELQQLSRQALQMRRRKPCNTSCHTAMEGPSDLEIYSLPAQLESQFGGGGTLGKDKLTAWLKGSESPESFDFPLPSAQAPDLRFNPFRYEKLIALSEADKQQLFQLEKSIVETQWRNDKKYAETGNYLKWVVEAGYGGGENFEAKLQSHKRLAQAYVEAGATDKAIQIYQSVLKNFPTQPTAGSDARQLAFRRIEIQHELASIYVQNGLKFASPGDLETAAKLLDSAFQELQGLSVAGAKLNKKGQNPFQTLKETLHLQNRFLKAECLLSKAKNEEDLKAGQTLLEDLVYKTPVDLWNLEAGDPQEALLGRIQIRLAELYYSRPNLASSGDALIARVLREHPKDSYLPAQALMVQGSYKLQNGQAQDALRLFRRIQDEYPNSQAAMGLTRSGLLAKFKDAQGKIRTDVDAADLGEAIKVMLDRSGNGPSGRTWAYAGGGFVIGTVIGLVIAPEFTIPALLGGALTGGMYGSGVGVLASRVHNVAENWGDVRDAYSTGYSNVDMDRNIRNIFMLGLDLALLIPAGAVGRVVGEGAKAGMSYGLRSASRLGIEWAGNRSVQMIATRAIPAAANYLTAYTVLEAERSLFYGTKFKWNAYEAGLMMMMCTNFAMAHRLGVGSRLATYAKFPGSKLLPVVQEGELIGFTTATGKAVGWATDTTLGATVHYGMVLGLDKKYGLKNYIPGFHLSGYGDFVAEQLATLGALHLGSKAAGKLSHDALDNALLKLDKQSNKWLAEARKNIKNNNGDGFGPRGPWGLQEAYAGANVPPPARPFNMETPGPKGPTIVMMDGGGGGRIEVMESELHLQLNKNPPKGSTLEVWLENSSSAKLIEALKAEAQRRGIRFEVKDIENGSSLKIEADKDGKVRATTTDVDMAKRAPGQVELIKNLPTSTLVAKQVSDLAGQGIKRLKLTIPAEDLPAMELADCTRIAVENGMELELSSAKSGNIKVSVAGESSGMAIRVNGIELGASDPAAREAVEKLTRSALQAQCQRLQLGKGILISRAGSGGLEYSFSTQLPLERVQGVFAEYLAFESGRAVKADPALLGDLAQFWKGAMRHAIETEKNVNLNQSDLKKLADAEAKQEEYAAYTNKGHWIQKWQNSAQAMGQFAAHGANRSRLKNVFELLTKFSQPNHGDLLGFKPFNGRSLDDNGFELMRLFEACRNNPQLNLLTVLDKISMALGNHGNVGMYGAIVGTVYKTMVPKVDANGRTVYDRAAQNEFDRLLEMKDELKPLSGKYRITVIPEDRLQGSNFRSNNCTKTPEWTIETLGPDGKPTKALTVEVTQADGSKVSDADIQETLRRKVDQLTGHQFAKNTPVQQSLIVYKFYNAAGSEPSLIEATRRAVAAKAGSPPSQETKSLRVAVVFEYRIRGQSQYRISNIEFENGQWVATNPSKYFPADWYPAAKQAVGWK